MKEVYLKKSICIDSNSSNEHSLFKRCLNNLLVVISETFLSNKLPTCKGQGKTLNQFWKQECFYENYRSLNLNEKKHWL